VAVLRALQLGDMLCAVPALRALRRALPRAEITLIGLPWARSFARRFAHLLDGFHELRGYPGLPEQPARPLDIPAFLAAMQRQRFDLAIQMHGNGTVTNPLTVLLGARHTAGCYVPGQFCPGATGFVPYPEDVHEIRRPLALLAALGIPPEGEDLEFPLRDRDFDAQGAQGALGALQLTAGDYVCLHPGSRSARRWPAERFAAVGDALAGTGLIVVLTGTSDEAALTRELTGRMRAPAIDVAGQTDLGGMAALLSGARLLVCNNTGVSHLAAALRVPSVVLIENEAEVARWAPLDAGRHRPVCGCDAAPPGAVLAHCRKLLELPRRSAAPADCRAGPGRRLAEPAAAHT
jgi:ADP-heptose:LPS heptosyltransferase